MTTGDYTPGRGYGVQPAPMNAPRAVELGVGVQPGTPNIIRARQVLVSGTNDGIFVYIGKPGPGNPPVASIVAPGVTTDPYGNTVASILEVQESGLQTVLAAAGLTMQKLSGTHVPPLISLADNTSVTTDGTSIHSAGIITPIVEAVQPGTAGTAETWHPLSLAAGWTGTLNYRMDAIGRVEFDMDVTFTDNGTTHLASGTAIQSIALPAAYSPSTTKFVQCGLVPSGAVLAANRVPEIQIGTGGGVLAVGVTTSAVGQTAEFRGQPSYPLT